MILTENRKELKHLWLIIDTIKVEQVASHLQVCNKVVDKTLTIDTWGPLSPLGTQHAQDMVDLPDHLQGHPTNSNLYPQQGTLVSKTIIGKIR
jgi:hypothetical protein